MSELTEPAESARVSAARFAAYCNRLLRRFARRLRLGVIDVAHPMGAEYERRLRLYVGRYVGSDR